MKIIISVFTCFWTWKKFWDTTKGTSSRAAKEAKSEVNQHCGVLKWKWNQWMGQEVSLSALNWNIWTLCCTDSSSSLYRVGLFPENVHTNVLSDLLHLQPQALILLNGQQHICPLSFLTLPAGVQIRGVQIRGVQIRRCPVPQKYST